MGLTSKQQSEVEDARATSHATRRATVDAIEEILYEPISVLDHGFVRVIDYMGDDSAIVQAARVSYGTSTLPTAGWVGDEAGVAVPCFADLPVGP